MRARHPPRDPRSECFSGRLAIPFPCRLLSKVTAAQRSSADTQCVLADTVAGRFADLLTFAVGTRPFGAGIGTPPSATKHKLIAVVLV